MSDIRQYIANKHWKSNPTLYFIRDVQIEKQ